MKSAQSQKLWPSAWRPSLRPRVLAASHSFSLSRSPYRRAKKVCDCAKWNRMEKQKQAHCMRSGHIWTPSPANIAHRVSLFSNRYVRARTCEWKEASKEVQWDYVFYTLQRFFFHYYFFFLTFSSIPALCHTSLFTCYVTESYAI